MCVFHTLLSAQVPTCLSHTGAEISILVRLFFFTAPHICLRRRLPISLSSLYRWGDARLSLINTICFRHCHLYRTIAIVPHLLKDHKLDPRWNRGEGRATL